MRKHQNSSENGGGKGDPIASILERSLRVRPDQARKEPLISRVDGSSWCNGGVRRVRQPHDDLSQRSPALGSLAHTCLTNERATPQESTPSGVGRGNSGGTRNRVGVYGIGGCTRIAEYSRSMFGKYYGKGAGDALRYSAPARKGAGSGKGRGEQQLVTAILS